MERVAFLTSRLHPVAAMSKEVSRRLNIVRRRELHRCASDSFSGAPSKTRAAAWLEV